jgi:hypothetical protein
MRKIEMQMNEAVQAKTSWSNANTTVSYLASKDTSDVFLHGHHIAAVKKGVVVVNIYTLAHWPTNTTRSRLRALGADVCQRKGEQYVDGVAI